MRDTTYDEFKKEKSSALKEVRHYSEYVALRSARWFASLWPIRVNQKIGRALGNLVFHLARKDRGVAEYQLGFCFPEMDKDRREKLIRQTFQNMGTSLFEALVIQKFRKNPEKWIRLENTHIVHEALKQKKGLVMMFGHVGNWELFSIIYETLGIKGIAVESPVGDSRLDHLLLSIRKSPNIKMIPRGDRASAREILKCFRNNHVFLFAMDQDTKVKTVFVDFFGRKAATAVGAATFAKKFNAPVVSAFGARMPDGTHRYSFELLSQGPYQDGEEELKSLTASYNKALERHIRQYPDQWVWFHRRWKSQPNE